MLGKIPIPQGPILNWVNNCIDYAISEAVDYTEFDELKVSLKIAMKRL